MVELIPAILSEGDGAVEIAALDYLKRDPALIAAIAQACLSCQPRRIRATTVADGSGAAAFSLTPATPYSFAALKTIIRNVDDDSQASDPTITFAARSIIPGGTTGPGALIGNVIECSMDKGRFSVTTLLGLFRLIGTGTVEGGIVPYPVAGIAGGEQGTAVDCNVANAAPGSRIDFHVIGYGHEDFNALLLKLRSGVDPKSYADDLFPDMPLGLQSALSRAYANRALLLRG